MDPKEEERLRKLLNEVSTDESENFESEPYSSEDDIRDHTYQGSSSEESLIDVNELHRDTEQREPQNETRRTR